MDSFCHTNPSTKNANFQKPTQISMFLDRIWSIFSVFLHIQEIFVITVEISMENANFLIMRPWFSFWACASSFSEKSFLFIAVMDSRRINTLAIKCDKLSDDYDFCYKAVRSSLILLTLGKLIVFEFSIQNLKAVNFLQIHFLTRFCFKIF